MTDPAQAPCGTCDKCRAVRYGGDEWCMSSLREVSPAEFKNSEEALAWLRHCLKYGHEWGRQPAWDGLRSRNVVLLINEAHRLTKPQKAALLTELEYIEEVHVLAATTNIKEMQIERERPIREDPLISRGTIFQFDFPLIREAAAGLRRDASRVGLALSEEAAVKVAMHNRITGDAEKASARGCLEDLYLLSAMGKTIGEEEVAFLYSGKDSVCDTAEDLPVSSDGGDTHDGGLY